MAEDPKLSQRYRELPREEPPRALDEAILAAARRAAQSRPAPLVVPTGRRRWYFPVAAAAVIVLAVAVVVHIDREQPDMEIVTPSARVLETPPPPPVAQPRAEAPAASRRDAAPQAAQKPARQPFTPDPQGDSGRPAESARPQAAAPAASIEEERKAIDELRARESDNQGTRARAQGAPSRQATTSASALARVAPSPEQWLQGIVDLRRQGRHEEADRELAEFRKHYPAYRLSDEMKAKVERR